MSKTASSGVPWSKWVLALGGLHVLLHALTNGNYGIFRDEFYYLACADHLAWGYVDHPPLSIALLGASRALLGDSVHAVRVLVALAGGCLVVLTGLTARELGGGRFAQLLAALCTAIAPSYLVLTGFYSMNAFDFVFWAVSFLLVVRIVKTGDPRLWVSLGAVVGLGLLNKIGILFFVFGLGVGLVATRHRTHLLDRHLWVGGLVAALLFLPYVLWNVENGWPTLEFMSNAKQYKIAGGTPLEFFLGQVLEIHPLNALVWLVGLYSLLLGRNRRFRIIGVIYVAAFVAFAAQKSKVYYLAPAYPPLLAAGACAIEAFARGRGRSWVKPAIVGLIALGGIATSPMAVPVLPVEKLTAYQQVIGIKGSASESHEMGALDQHFADRFGWENMTATVASVFKALAPEQQGNCVILTRNYGEAGAINYYGGRYGLPPAVSGHNNYYLWGPGDASGNVVIAIGVPHQLLAELFDKVTVAAAVVSPYAMPYETDIPVHVCTGLRIPLQEAWHHTKLFI